MAGRHAACALGAMLVMMSASAVAAPFAGLGRASATGPAQDAGHAVALERARRAALEQALSQLEGVDASARANLLEAVDAWTGAYRILASHNDGATIEVHVEVDIDVERLRKRVAPMPLERSPMWVLRDVTLEGCGPADLDERRVRDEWQAFGFAVVGSAANRVSLAVRCLDRGQVRHTHVRAARVELHVRAVGPRAFTMTTAADGFAGIHASAVQHGLHRALQTALAPLTRAHEDLELRVAAGAAAAAIRRLERALTQSVSGVESAKLTTIENDGDVRLELRGIHEVEALAQRLRELSVPGLTLSVIGIDADGILTIQLS